MKYKIGVLTLLTILGYFTYASTQRVESRLVNSSSREVIFNDNDSLKISIVNEKLSATYKNKSLHITNADELDNYLKASSLVQIRVILTKAAGTKRDYIKKLSTVLEKYDIESVTILNSN